MVYFQLHFTGISSAVVDQNKFSFKAKNGYYMHQEKNDLNIKTWKAGLYVLLECVFCLQSFFQQSKTNVSFSEIACPIARNPIAITKAAVEIFLLKLSCRQRSNRYGTYQTEFKFKGIDLIPRFGLRG